MVYQVKLEIISTFMKIGSEVNLLSSLGVRSICWLHIFPCSEMMWNILYLQPQCKHGFHIYFTSFHCTGRYELNKLTSLPMCGFTAQLVEHRTGITEVMGLNPVEALIFFRLLPSNCLNWKIYCDDHSSLSSTTAVQIWISYIFHIVCILL